MEVCARFRDPRLAKRLAKKIRALEPGEPVKFCHVCGTHEWTISHYGIRSLLPENVEVVAGPGCPVCITPAALIDAACELALDGVVVATYGDMFRAPGTRGSLYQARAEGADVRVVYSITDAVKMAREEPGRDFVFFAIGFETTAPSTAVEVLRRPPRNLSFLVAHRLIPPAMELLAGMEELAIRGFIAPGHVSTIIGAQPYAIFPERYNMPVVVAGFEPLDVLMAIYMLLRQLKEGVARLENEYTRAVRWEGNLKAKEFMRRAFDVADGAWRGLGVIPNSALELKEALKTHDAVERYGLDPGRSGRDVPPGCRCHEIMIGKAYPTDCPLFLRACRPDRPVGPCMVSVEGTCRIWALEGGWFKG
ncbi:hydrogenase formation protein HypD [Candidatus Bathyarchaeota archaeon]|nr:MAG: hydrogenase formation protein HypD [Candidatus Bathyarchaeota archaeon]